MRLRELGCVPARSAVAEELDVDAEAAVRAERPPITRRQNDAMLGRDGGDQRVVDGAAADLACRQGWEQIGRCLGGEETASGERRGKQLGNDSRAAARRAGQARQHRERLERGMSCEAEDTFADSVRHRRVVSMVDDHERDGDARVDEQIRRATGDRRHAALARGRRR